MAKEETVDIQKELFREGGRVGKYQHLVLGEKGWFRLLKYELIIGLSSWIPGALGLWLRSKLYPFLFGHVGRNVTFGRGIVLRHPKKIFIADNVVVDDFCVLDAKGRDNRGIFIGEGVYVGRNTILNCKNGDIVLEDNVNLSANCMIFSASEVRVGAGYLIGAYSYLAGGTHDYEDPTVPVFRQRRFSEGIRIEPGGWIGAHVTVFDGVRIGKHTVIAAGSVVSRNIPDYAVAGGNPVTIINKRKVEESPRSKKPITIGIVNFNGREVLEETLDSVMRQDYPAIEEIVLVDNRSTDESVAFVRERYPNVKILRMESNRGPNPARNVVLRKAKTELVLLMDNDIVLNPDVATLLEEAFLQNPQAGVVSAQIRIYGDPERIQFNGANIYFVGGAIQNRMDFGRPMSVGAVPAGTILVDRRKAEAIGGFDEDYFYGWADGDFTFRMTISGYPCVVVPDARVFHKKSGKGLSWVRYQVRNRWWFILKTYHLRTLIVLLPAVLVYQTAILGYLTAKGRLGDFIRGSLAVVGSLPRVLQKRKAVLKMKKVRDREVLFGKGMDLLGDTADSVLFRMVHRLFRMFSLCYWVVAKHLVK